MPRSSHVRSLTARSAIAAIAASGALIAAASTATAAPVFATNDAGDSLRVCEAGDAPGIGNSATFRDLGVAVFVGGNLDASNAELEGRVVVVGDATFTHAQSIGGAGAGSGIAPRMGSDVLIVGGNLNATGGSLKIGHSQGGDVRIGGDLTGGLDFAVDPSDSMKSLGSASTDLGKEIALGKFTSFSSDLSTLSSGLDAKTSTGTTTVDGGTITFTADGDGPQIFDVEADAFSSVREIQFNDLSKEATVVVNVEGSNPSLTIKDIRVDGERVDNPAEVLAADEESRLGDAATRILWNFNNAEDLTLAGTSQFVGTVLAPAADAKISTSTNGRRWIGGNVDDNGAGMEHHNYPWYGDIQTSCEPTGEPTSPATETTPDPEPTTSTPTDSTDDPSEEPATEPSNSAEPTETPSESPEATATKSPTTEVLGTSVPSPESTKAAEESDGLAVTGATVGWAASVAGLLIAAGVTVLVLRRRTV